MRVRTNAHLSPSAWRSRAIEFSRTLAPRRSASRYTPLRRRVLWWDDDDAMHIRSRSIRYPGADNIEPSWTLGAADDANAVVRDPDPASRSGYIRLFGYSTSSGFELTVIIDPQDWSGVTA